MTTISIPILAQSGSEVLDSKNIHRLAESQGLIVRSPELRLLEQQVCRAVTLPKQSKQEQKNSFIGSEGAAGGVALFVNCASSPKSK